ncbi:MAG: hypothetical protein N2510_04910 [Ignavibacteria bacterium]|nr:hypothetical protein [Ignavibacteria bacterium]
MKLATLFLSSLFLFTLNSQENNLKQELKLSFNEKSSEIFQLKKRKTTNAYFGAGYSFIIFTDREINSIYPILDTRNGTFLTNINLFFGFAIAQAVSAEIEPGILFTNSTKVIKTSLKGVPHTRNGTDTLIYSSNIGMFAIPLAVNVRFFPMFKRKDFARLFFIGGGLGTVWVSEDYDNLYTGRTDIIIGSGYGYSLGGPTESTSQWAPLFRAMIGFTGTGGQFGFGGELRYNIVPLKQIDRSPFRTRVAKNFNSVDLSLRFYFSL